MCHYVSECQTDCDDQDEILVYGLIWHMNWKTKTTSYCLLCSLELPASVKIVLLSEVGEWYCELSSPCWTISKVPGG